MPKLQTARSGGGPAKDAASGGVSDHRGASGLPAPRVGEARQVSHRHVEKYSQVHTRHTLSGNARALFWLTWTTLFASLGLGALIDALDGHHEQTPCTAIHS